jgi:hypothetical protein
LPTATCEKSCGESEVSPVAFDGWVSVTTLYFDGSRIRSPGEFWPVQGYAPASNPYLQTIAVTAWDIAIDANGVLVRVRPIYLALLPDVPYAPIGGGSRPVDVPYPPGLPVPS